jgi:hypothetical protein
VINGGMVLVGKLPGHNVVAAVDSIVVGIRTVVVDSQVVVAAADAAVDPMELLGSDPSCCVVVVAVEQVEQ